MSAIDWSRIRRVRSHGLNIEFQTRHDNYGRTIPGALVTAADLAALGAFLQALVTVIAQDNGPGHPDSSSMTFLTSTKTLIETTIGPARITLVVEDKYNEDDYREATTRVQPGGST